MPKRLQGRHHTHRHSHLPDQGIRRESHEKEFGYNLRFIAVLAPTNKLGWRAGGSMLQT